MLELPCSEAARSSFRFSRSSFKLPVPVDMFPIQCVSTEKMKYAPPRVIGGHCSEFHEVKKARGHHSYAFLSQSTQVSIGSEHIFDKISDLNIYSDHVLQNGSQKMFLLTKTRHDNIKINFATPHGVRELLGF